MSENNIMTKKNQLTLKSIGDLLEYSFNIPSYQRGYRWKGAYQVKDLLDDIWEYKLDYNNPEAFYCLQPIVVKPILEEPIKDNYFELIDGQQRLTTILLMLHYFNETEFKIAKPYYSIDFETRLKQRNFLETVSDNEYSESNIDLFHINKAYSFIENWFEKMEKENSSIRGDFYSKLVNRVKVIWYAITEEADEKTSVFDIFTRLNIGKIPLTNAELIKALFLSKSGDSSDPENKNLKQINIASEWDKIEQTLQQSNFWHSICNTPEKYDTRIEYIFDLIKNKNENDENYFTFHKYVKEFEEEKSIDKIWLEVKEYFLTFEEWHQNQELYHLVGYLISVGKDIKTLKKESKDKTKTKFKQWLKEEALNSLKKDNIDSLNFHSDKSEIRKTLLLFNILSILENPKSSLRFPFDYFHSQKWDIEHVSSQTTKEINGKDRDNWAITNLEYFTGNTWEIDNEDKFSSTIELLETEEKGFCENLIKIIQKKDPNNNIFLDTFNALELYFNVNKTLDDPDGISNLALLDEGTNRMYKNAFFPVKRKHIIQKEKEAIFIPLCTRNVFLKVYTKKLGEVMYWNNNDGIDYIEEIKKVLKP